MKVKDLFRIWVLILPGWLHAQYGYVTGNVSDRFGPIANAAVSIANSPYGTFTDAKGYFAFEIDTGVYQINIELTGYQSYQTMLRLDNLDQKELNIRLENNLMDGSVGVGSKSTESENQIDSPVPVDLILAEDLINTGEVELSAALHQLLPNFYSSKQSADDAINIIDPVSLRGLGPDQLLILVNGKRRHKSAFLNVSDVFGKGTAGTDLNTIPIAAIEKIEILRDGASSQYGSDAIAGVMNIVLKERVIQTHVEAYGGATTQKDGNTGSIKFNTGFGFAERGFINITGSFAQQGAINRGGEYTGPIFGAPVLDQNTQFRDEFLQQTGFPNKTVAELGSSQYENASLFLNSNFEITDNFDVYGFGGINNKIGKINGLYRMPFSKEQLTVWYDSTGFSPRIVPEVADRSLVLGIKGKTLSDWFVDVSYGRGSNNVDMTVSRSNNASMGITTPFTAYAGGYYYAHDIISADFSKEVNLSNSTLDIAFGGEYRIENYSLKQGETESYIFGGDSTVRILGDSISPDQPKESGIQGYRGIREEDVLDKIRTNGSAYVELDYSWKRIKLVGALRQEVYSDFGSRSNFKVAGSFKLANQLVVRGSFSTGFKAPSLPQLYYQRASNVLVENNFSTSVLFNTESAFFGNVLSRVGTLSPELSESINVGFTSAINRNLSLSLDLYRTLVMDRIGLSQRISTNISANQAQDIFSELRSEGIDYFQLFTNIIDTKTKGLDFVFIGQYPIRNTLVKFDSRFSYINTEITFLSENVSAITDSIGITYNRSEIGIIESYVPNFKWRNSMTFSMNRLKLNISHTLYGETTYLHPDDELPADWLVNTNTGQVESRDQTFTPKHIVNINLKVKVLPSSNLTIGVNNLTNQYPDPLRHSENIIYGVNKYSQSVRPFNLKGTYIFTRLDISF